MMKRLSVVSVPVLLLGLLAEPQATITGQITDPMGAVVAKARVLIHCDRGSGCTTDDVGVYTDARGNYSAAVEAGAYDLFVSSSGMTPVAVRVIIKAGKK